MVNKKNRTSAYILSSSSNSNGTFIFQRSQLQNIPIKMKKVSIRQAFYCNGGYKIIAADYSQIELRIMAHLSHIMV